jgi:hypothetical protein
MLLHGTLKSLLEGIVRWLGMEISQNDAEWQAHADLVQSCLSDMVEIMEPTEVRSIGVTSRYFPHSVADKLNRAMPHVRSMLTAMRDRDRTTALAYGETTLQWL